MSTRHPLENHPYHNKTDAELRYIAKDAGEAARAMKNHSPQAEKYLDQVNDASTVLNFRKNGMPDWYKEKYGHNVTTRHPLENHPYHNKTDAELRYIAKDAGEAARAMKNHSPQAEKYLDQVNDASTVLNFRKNGMPDWYKEKYGHNVKKESKSFTKMLEAYDTHGLSVFSNNLTEEPDNEQFTKELRAQEAKAAGRAPQAEVAKGAVKGVKIQNGGEVKEEVEQIDEGSSTSRTPWRDINSPEYKKLSQDIRRRSEEENAAKPGKTLLAKIQAKKKIKEEVEQIDELSRETLTNYKNQSIPSYEELVGKAITAKTPEEFKKYRIKAKNRATGTLGAAERLGKMGEEVELDDEVLDEMLSEVLTKDDTAAEFIHDFVHSDDPRFKDSSKKERIQRALAAYYKKQRER